MKKLRHAQLEEKASERFRKLANDCDIAIYPALTKSKPYDDLRQRIDAFNRRWDYDFSIDVAPLDLRSKRYLFENLLTSARELVKRLDFIEVGEGG